MVLQNVGAVYYIQGIYTRAVDAYQDLLIIQQELGDQFGQEAALHLLGIIYHIQGDYEQTLTYYRQALTIQNKLSNRSDALELQYVVRIYYTLEKDKQSFFDRIHFIQDRYEEIVTYYQQSLTSLRKASTWVGEDEANYSVDAPKQDHEAFWSYTRSLAKELVSIILPDLADDFSDIANLFFTQVIAYSESLNADTNYSLALSLGRGKLELLELLTATYITTRLMSETLSSQEIDNQLRASQLQEIAYHQAKRVAQDLGYDSHEAGIFADNYAAVVIAHGPETLRELIKWQD